MSNIVSSLRDALVADLAAQFPDADVMSGLRVGKAVDGAKIAVAWIGFGERSNAVVVGEAKLIVRYWPATPRVRDDATAGVRDPSQLEQAALDLATFLQTKQTSYSALGVWFVRLVGVEPDYDPDEWGVEATLLAMFDNPAVIST